MSAAFHEPGTRWDQAVLLARRLTGLGFTAEAAPDSEPGGGWPVVEVSSGRGLMVHEDGVFVILTAPDWRGVPCWWWEPLDPIAPLDDLGAVVLAATRLLPCPGERCARCTRADSGLEWQEAEAS